MSFTFWKQLVRLLSEKKRSKSMSYRGGRLLFGVDCSLAFCRSWYQPHCQSQMGLAFLTPFLQEIPQQKVNSIHSQLANIMWRISLKRKAKKILPKATSDRRRACKAAGIAQKHVNQRLWCRYFLRALISLRSQWPWYPPSQFTLLHKQSPFSIVKQFPRAVRYHNCMFNVQEYSTF